MLLGIYFSNLVSIKLQFLGFLLPIIAHIVYYNRCLHNLFAVSLSVFHQVHAVAYHLYVLVLFLHTYITAPEKKTQLKCLKFETGWKRMRADHKLKIHIKWHLSVAVLSKEILKCIYL